MAPGTELPSPHSPHGLFTLGHRHDVCGPDAGAGRKHQKSPWTATRDRKKTKPHTLFESPSFQEPLDEEDDRDCGELAMKNVLRACTADTSRATAFWLLDLPAASSMPVHA